MEPMNTWSRLSERHSEISYKVYRLRMITKCFNEELGGNVSAALMEGMLSECFSLLWRCGCCRITVSVTTDLSLRALLLLQEHDGAGGAGLPRLYITFTFPRIYATRLAGKSIGCGLRGVICVRTSLSRLTLGFAVEQRKMSNRPSNSESDPSTATRREKIDKNTYLFSKTTSSGAT